MARARDVCAVKILCESNNRHRCVFPTRRTAPSGRLESAFLPGPMFAGFASLSISKIRIRPTKATFSQILGTKCRMLASAPPLNVKSLAWEPILVRLSGVHPAIEKEGAGLFASQFVALAIVFKFKSQIDTLPNSNFRFHCRGRKWIAFQPGGVDTENNFLAGII